MLGMPTAQSARLWSVPSMKCATCPVQSSPNQILGSRPSSWQRLLWLYHAESGPLLCALVQMLEVLELT